MKKKWDTSFNWTATWGKKAINIVVPPGTLVSLATWKKVSWDQWIHWWTDTRHVRVYGEVLLLFSALCSLTSTNQSIDDNTLCAGLRTKVDTWEGSANSCLAEDTQLISESAAYMLIGHKVSSFNFKFTL